MSVQSEIVLGEEATVKCCIHEKILKCSLHRELVSQFGLQELNDYTIKGIRMFYDRV